MSQVLAQEFPGEERLAHDFLEEGIVVIGELLRHEFPSGAGIRPAFQHEVLGNVSRQNWAKRAIIQ
jgi:hypothetical protein